MRIWRNWQTRTVQVRVKVTSWGFESLYPHQIKEQSSIQNSLPIWKAVLLYKENPVLDTGFVEAMRLNNNFPTVKLKLRSGNCNKV